MEVRTKGLFKHFFWIRLLQDSLDMDCDIMLQFLQGIEQMHGPTIHLRDTDIHYNAQISVYCSA